MFFKTVFVFFASSILSVHSQVTPEDLADYFEYVDTRIKGYQHETEISIRDYLAPLETYVREAQTGIISNITGAAKPYWTEIQSLQQAAGTQGQDISECVNLGNQQLYALNNSIANQAHQAYNSLNKSANDILISSSTQAYSVIEELLGLGQVIRLCKDETCATDLKKIATQFYQRGMSTLDDAVTKSENYVLVYLPVLLASHDLNTESYAANYTLFLSDVTNCINNL